MDINKLYDGVLGRTRYLKNEIQPIKNGLLTSETGNSALYIVFYAVIV